MGLMRTSVDALMRDYTFVVIQAPDYGTRGQAPDYGTRGQAPDYSTRGQAPDYSTRGQVPIRIQSN
jgi:hypothetical protein